MVENDLNDLNDLNDVKLTKYLSLSLRQERVSHVFMIPGGYVDNFAKDLVNVDGMNVVVCASEAGAAMMADGFARVSRRFGVCLAISGPGASNMITGLTLSKVDRIPVLAITGDNPLVWRDRGSIQDAGSQGLGSLVQLSHATDKQYQLFEAGLAEEYLRRSLVHFDSFDPGPVHLSVPMDVQVEDLQPNYISQQASSGPRRIVDQAGLDHVYEKINQCTKVVMLVGSGVRKSEAGSALIAFAELFSIPVATTMGAKGEFPEDHPLSLGVFGWAGSEQANETIMNNDLDCLLVVGSKLGQIATMCWDESLVKNRALIQIDLNASNLNQAYVADLAIVSDAGAALSHLTAKHEENRVAEECTSTGRERLDWVETVRSVRNKHYQHADALSEHFPLHPGYVISRIRQEFPSDAQIFVDNGAHTFFTAHYWESRGANEFFTAIKYSGAMGWAIPASIGAKFSDPAKTTLAVVGDGCMLMQGMEIQTAVRYGLKGIVFVILNNRAHGNPKIRLGDVSEKEHAVTDIVDHNWAQFAEAFGAKGYTVNEASDIQPVFEEALVQDRPVVVDVKCGLYETPTKCFDESFMKEFNRYISG